MDVVLCIIGAATSLAGMVTMKWRQGMGVGLWIGGIVIMLAGLPFV